MQICGGDWAKHSTETGGYFRCNITTPPQDLSSLSADSPLDGALDAESAQDQRSSQPAVGQAGQVAGARLLGTLFGRFASAGARWKLDFFMRRFLAHECSQRQLQVVAQELHMPKSYISRTDLILAACLTQLEIASRSLQGFAYMLLLLTLPLQSARHALLHVGHER